MQEASVAADDSLRPGPVPAEEPGSPDGVRAVASDKAEDVPDDKDFFSCNICYETAVNPVVTLCGHLYCWPCLYRWLQVQRHSHTCPVCKAGVDESKVVPIYGRGREGVDPRTQTQPREPTKAIPSRPLGQRTPPVVRAAAAEAQQAQHGMGLMPALFGLQPGAGGGSEPLTQEQQHQAFLSRLLLMLGSFVIMCLLLF
ncbi:hypothetical protein ACKKBG_A26890 [Auxenochlorella protothecoides x Auxenochlorella symbiontica]|nr:E3 ubiquitin-protein ligase [Auxenochlorella protothecoides]KFM25009.1 E3 ubiquitin-protein ligase [Auxenochlorella protothecoides]